MPGRKWELARRRGGEARRLKGCAHEVSPPPRSLSPSWPVARVPESSAQVPATQDGAEPFPSPASRVLTLHTSTSGRTLILCLLSRGHLESSPPQLMRRERLFSEKKQHAEQIQEEHGLYSGVCTYMHICLEG